MAPIKNVAVIGGSGNVGKAIVQELLAAGFVVTALTRSSSSSTFPDGVKVKKVDYESIDSLKEAFGGQDVVVSAIATPAVQGQKTIIDAAIAAGVKRFIPSEFGINTRITGGTAIGKILSGKVAIVDYLDEKSKSNPEVTWTGVSTGLFFDWGLDNIASVDFDNKTVRVVDSGNEKFQASNLKYIGKAVASILKHPDQTANKYLSVASFNVSHNEIIKVVEELTGTTFTVDRVDSEELQKLGEEKLSKGDFSAFLPLLQRWNFADGKGHAVKPGDSADELLELPKDDLKESIRAWLTKNGRL